MGKYTKDLNPELAKKVTDIAVSRGLKSCGIDIRPIGMKKNFKTYGTILKGNDITELFTGNNSIVAVALNEPLFNEMDEQTQDILIESLMSQISYDMEKDKIVITKPEINIPYGMYVKYGSVMAQKLDCALLTLSQLEELDKEEKLKNKKSKK